MADKKIIAVLGATGAQGGGLVRAILNDTSSEFAVRRTDTRQQVGQGTQACISGSGDCRRRYRQRR